MPTASPEPPEPADSPDADAQAAVHEARLWRDDGWTARVIKNEDDEGWAVEMTRHDQAEPALVGPWTMGRDKRNPKPLDAGAFNTLVKTASEFVRRTEQQRHAELHKRIDVTVQGARVSVALDIDPDEDDPHGVLTATDAYGNPLGQARVAPNFRLTGASALAWVEGGFGVPR